MSQRTHCKNCAPPGDSSQLEKILEDPSDPKSITISKIHQILNESTTQCVRTTDLDLSTPNQHSIHRETTENPTPSGSGHFPTSTQTLLWETTLQNPSLPSGKLNFENPNTTSGSDDNTTYSTAYLEKLETPTPKKRIGEINLNPTKRKPSGSEPLLLLHFTEFITVFVTDDSNSLLQWYIALGTAQYLIAITARWAITSAVLGHHNSSLIMISCPTTTIS